MTTRIQAPPAAKLNDPAIPEILEAMREGWWSDGALAQVLSHRPESLKTTVGLVETLFMKSEIDPELLELLRITVAETRDDEYGKRVRVQPFKEPVETKRTGGLTEAESVAVRVAERMVRNPHTVDDELFAQLKEHFTDQEVVAVVFAISVFSMASMIAIALHLDTESDGMYGAGLVYRQEHIKS
jgi:alkylhydroperoxidase family enzyme